MANASRIPGENVVYKTTLELFSTSRNPINLVGVLVLRALANVQKPVSEFNGIEII